MNQKTAKLIRKYAEATSASQNQLKRDWNAMDQFERRDFRVQMRSEVEAHRAQAASAPAEEPAGEDEAAPTDSESGEISNP